MPNTSILPYGPQYDILKIELRAAGFEVREICEHGPFVKLLVIGLQHSTTVLIERMKHGYSMFSLAAGKRIDDDVIAIRGELLRDAN